MSERFQIRNISLDTQYSKIKEIEIQVNNVQSGIRNINQKKISGDNIYRLLLVFDQVYASVSEVERKEFMQAFINRIEMFLGKPKMAAGAEKFYSIFPPREGEITELPL